MVPNTSMQCYAEDPCDKQFKKFINETCQKYRNIERRLVAFRPSYRICCLSIPTRRSRIYKPPIRKCCKRDIEIIHPNEYPYTTPTRLKQLAFPSVRRLVALRNNYKNVFRKERTYVVNRHLRQSLLSVYSRLANIQPPPKKVYPTKWTAAEWKLRTKKYLKMATPKKIKQPPKIKRPQKTLAEMKKSIKKLSKPKNYTEFPTKIWVFTDELKKYKPSNRIKALATLVVKPFDGPLPSPVPIPETALTYKASARIKELAMHRERKATADEGERENPFEISPNALKAKASKRTKELAQPKEVENPPQKELPWKISPNALKAKPSQRLIELSKPKGAKE